MPREVERLSRRKIARLVKEPRPGRHADGDGLYLQTPEVSWISLFRFEGKRHELGLGPYPRVSLEAARVEHAEVRRLLGKGVNPLAERRKKCAEAKLDVAKAMTFKQCTEAYFTAHRAGWRNEKHAVQWSATLSTYAYPIIGALPVQAIDTALVMKVLEQEVRGAPDKPGAPFWTARTETASRLRGRIESVLDYARVRTWRTGENPARWRGHLDKLLPKPSKVQTVAHHAALPYAELPAFMAELRKQDGIAARGLEFLVLTATRTSEVLGARWDEIDLKAKLWTVPPERMKAGKEHRVPLSARAVAILEEMQGLEEPYLFPGKRAAPMNNQIFLSLLRRMNRAGLTAHGFRSTFRDWAAERTTFPSEMAEMALAHAVSSKVEAAYRRGDLFERRARMMAAWSAFAAVDKAGEVVPLTARTGVN